MYCLLTELYGNIKTKCPTLIVSAFVLILILASFAFKFSITYLMENDAMLLMSFTFQCLWGVGSGTATGLSWGGLLYVIYKLREKSNTTLLKS